MFNFKVINIGIIKLYVVGTLQVPKIHLRELYNHRSYITFKIIGTYT